MRQVTDEGVKQRRSIQIVNKQPLIRRNQLCPCGSGIKFKRCHYATRRRRAVNVIVHHQG